MNTLALEPLPEVGLHLVSSSSIPHIDGRDYLVRPQKLQMTETTSRIDVLGFALISKLSL